VKYCEKKKPTRKTSPEKVIENDARNRTQEKQQAKKRTKNLEKRKTVIKTV
jgi:hypothetical protein